MKQYVDTEKTKRGLDIKQQEATEKEAAAKDLVGELGQMVEAVSKKIRDVQKKTKESSKLRVEVSTTKDKLLATKLKRLADVSSRSTFVPSKRARPELSINSTFPADLLAQVLVPSEFSSYTAVQCKADGNCLFNATSLLIEGWFAMKLTGPLLTLSTRDLFPDVPGRSCYFDMSKLNSFFITMYLNNMFVAGDYSAAECYRQKAANELVTKSKQYARHPHLMQAANEMGCDVATALQSVVKKVEKSRIDSTDATAVIAEEGRQTEKDGTWSSVLQLLALSNVTGRSITSVFPDVATIRPFNFLVKPAGDIVLMWSRYSLDNNSKIYVPDHVVPLVKMDK